MTSVDVWDLPIGKLNEIPGDDIRISVDGEGLSNLLINRRIDIDFLAKNIKFIVMLMFN